MGPAPVLTADTRSAGQTFIQQDTLTITRTYIAIQYVGNLRLAVSGLNMNAISRHLLLNQILIFSFFIWENVDPEEGPRMLLMPWLNLQYKRKSRMKSRLHE